MRPRPTALASARGTRIVDDQQHEREVTNTCSGVDGLAALPHAGCRRARGLVIDSLLALQALGRPAWGRDPADVVSGSAAGTWHGLRSGSCERHKLPRNLRGPRPRYGPWRDSPLTIVCMSMADDVVAIVGARARRLATPRPRTSSDRRRVRAERDPFDLWLAPSAGSRQSAESYGVAQALMLVLGDGEVPPVVDSYLRALSAAPVQHLRSLIRRGATDRLRAHDRRRSHLRRAAAASRPSADPSRMLRRTW